MSGSPAPEPARFGGKWCSYSAPPDLPFDQREEDGGSLVFDSEPLTDRVEVLGGPVVELDLSASEPVAMVAIRLSDVAPNGEATRVTYGLLNLTRRDSHADPKPLHPDERYRVRVQLNGVAQAFPASRTTTPGCPSSASRKAPSRSRCPRWNKASTAGT